MKGFKDQSLFHPLTLLSSLRKNLQRRFFLVVLGCGVISYLIYCLLESSSKKCANLNDAHNSFGLILDTPGCRIPKLDPYDKSVKDLIEQKGLYGCKGRPVFLVVQPNATLVLNESVLTSYYKVTPEKVVCHYSAIRRQPEPKGSVHENHVSYGKKTLLRFGVPLGEEFLKVECKAGKETVTQYLGLVPLKPSVEKTRSRNNTLNVVLIGIDSVSKLNFLRHFKKTHNFLTSSLSAFDMKGYNKVGDNTFPNLTPLLTGHFIEHYWNESLKKTFFFDSLDFIWKEYAAEGFRTMYAEDGVYYGTFNYLKRGFLNPPTDYYARPLGIGIADSKVKKDGGYYCLNNQLEFEIWYNYLKSFLETMEERASFSFTMVSSLTHDYLNYAGYADEPTYRILKDLHEMGIMNNSLVAVFSDHGIRFGSIRKTYLGKFEERMPFMYLTLPQWFLNQHPKIAKNLMINQNRLVTLFDLHATLQHFLKLSTNSSKNYATNALGLSMMFEISEYRTCETANILPHWCSCQVYQYIPPNDEMAVKVAAAVIDEINKKLDPMKEKCAKLETEKILDARVGQANDMVLRFVKHENDVIGRHVVYGDKQNPMSDYLVTLTARPGDGMFEGTVRRNSKDNSMQVLGISRINQYGQQSWCIDSQILKKFCFCK